MAVMGCLEPFDRDEVLETAIERLKIENGAKFF